MWRPSRLDLATGQVRWEIPWDEADRNQKMTPLGAHVAIWGMANIDLVEACDGARADAQPPGGGRFTAVGAEGYLSRRLVLAGRRALALAPPRRRRPRPRGHPRDGRLRPPIDTAVARRCQLP